MTLPVGLVLGFLLALLVGPETRAAGRKQPPRAILRDYYTVAEWASDAGLSLRWIKRDETAELSRNSTRIRLQVDSRQAEVNGIALWLLFPVTKRNGSLSISERDVQLTLKPLLSPPRSPGSKIRTICIDPGHGGKDPGFKSRSTQEKALTLMLAKDLRESLTRAGFKVTLTRTTDSFIELPTRPELAKRRNADLFISLHFNSVESGQGTVSGAEVYCLTPYGAPSTNARGEGGGSKAFVGNRNDQKNVFLAYQVQKALTTRLGAVDRGVHRARFVVLKEAVMPAVLIEAGFLSHPVESRKIRSADYRAQIARAILDGIVAYKAAVEPGASG